MKTCSAFKATIYCGLGEGYGGRRHTADEALALCRAYCDEVGLGVFLCPGTFAYTGGSEPGVAVVLIHYPRFPADDPAAYLRRHALALAARLKAAFKQERLTVEFPHEHLMLEGEAPP